MPSNQEDGGSVRMSGARRVRLLAQGIGMLLLVPLLLCFPIYWWNVADLEQARGLLEPYGTQDALLFGTDEVRCPSKEGEKTSDAAYDLLMRGRVFVSTHVPYKWWGMEEWLISHGPSFFSIADELVMAGQSRVSAWMELRDRIEKYCAKRALRTEIGMPVAPLRGVYAEAAQLAKGRNEGMKAALAKYDAIRVPFAILMWGWALFEAFVLFSLFVSLPPPALRILRAAREAKAGQGGSGSEPPAS